MCSTVHLRGLEAQNSTSDRCTNDQVSGKRQSGRQRGKERKEREEIEGEGERDREREKETDRQRDLLVESRVMFPVTPLRCHRFAHPRLYTQPERTHTHIHRHKKRSHKQRISDVLFREGRAVQHRTHCVVARAIETCKNLVAPRPRSDLHAYTNTTRPSKITRHVSR